MTRQRSKSHDVRAAAGNVSSMVGRSGEVVIYVVLKRQGGRVKVRGCLVLLVEDTSSFGKAVIRELLVCFC